MIDTNASAEVITVYAAISPVCPDAAVRASNAALSRPLTPTAPAATAEFQARTRLTPVLYSAPPAGDLGTSYGAGAERLRAAKRGLFRPSEWSGWRTALTNVCKEQP